MKSGERRARSGGCAIPRGEFPTIRGIFAGPVHHAPLPPGVRMKLGDLSQHLTGRELALRVTIFDLTGKTIRPSSISPISLVDLDW
jgi:hypothetical protein